MDIKGLRARDAYILPTPAEPSGESSYPRRQLRSSGAKGMKLATRWRYTALVALFLLDVCPNCLLSIIPVNAAWTARRKLDARSVSLSGITRSY